MSDSPHQKQPMANVALAGGAPNMGTVRRATAAATTTRGPVFALTNLRTIQSSENTPAPNARMISEIRKHGNGVACTNSSGLEEKCLSAVRSAAVLAQAKLGSRAALRLHGTHPYKRHAP